MLVRVQRMPWMALASVLALLTAALSIRAQEMSNFRVPPNAYDQNAAAASAANAAARRTSYRNTPSGFYGFPGAYVEAPGGAFLSGAADVISSQGQLVNDLENAKITREQRNQMRIDTRRRTFDENMYERKHRPTVEDERERARQLRLRRARNDPPLNEIWSGKALNDLLDGIQKMLTQGIPGPNIPLDPEILSRINVTSGTTPEGSLGLLRDGGKLRWPLTLRMSSFTSDRKQLDELAPKALSEAQSGEVSAETLQAMITSVDNLFSELKKNVRKINANDYIRSKRFLNDLEQTVKVLQDPNVSKYASRKWSAQGNNVLDLVSNMTRQGLKFAPAVPGDQAAYTSLHRAMVAFLTVDPGRSWDPFAK
jgi:hypothetical protein